MVAMISLPVMMEYINRVHGANVPDWKGRQIVDLLEARGKLNVTRAGNYRLIQNSEVGIVVDEFIRNGLIENEAAPQKSA